MDSDQPHQPHLHSASQQGSNALKKKEHEIFRGELGEGERKFPVVVTEYLGNVPNLHVPKAPPPFQTPSTQQVEGMSATASIFTLCNTAIGAGVLALPFAFQQSGLVGGILTCIAVGGIEAFTLYVLSKFAERYNCDSYGSLVRRTLGRKMSVALAIIMIAYLFGACVAYLIIIGDTFSALAALYLGHASILANRTYVILACSGLVLLPLCMFKNLAHLAWTSVLAVIGFVYSAGVIIALGIQETAARWPNPLEGVEILRLDVSILYALPIVVFGFNCHANVVSIFTELSDEARPLLRSPMKSSSDRSSYEELPTSLSNNPTLRRSPSLSRRRPFSAKLVNMLGVIIFSIGFILVAYVCVGASGYIGFRDGLAGNVLNALPQSNPFVQTAQGVTGMVVLLHYPLNHHPARKGIHDVLCLMGCERYISFVSFLFTCAFVGGSTGLAMVVTKLGDALHIIGGTAAAYMIFFLPGLMLINESVKKRSNVLLDQLQRDPSLAESLSMDEPLLQKAAVHGIKKTGIIYSPGKSWAAGIVLVAFSTIVFVLTISTL